MVELYRYLIIGFCGLILIGITFVTLAGTGPLLGVSLGPLWALGAIIFVITMILGFGLVAVAISIHDRHAELVKEVERIADLIEYRGTEQSQISNV